MDLRRLSRAPAGVERRLRDLHRRYATARFSTRLRFDPGAPPLLLSPHWDDAVLDCWTVLTQPGDLTVVNVFAGIPQAGQLTRWDRVTGATDSRVRAHERVVEDADALMQAGRTPLNLELLDAEYREPGPPPSPREIDAALTAAVGSASRVYAPAGLGNNADHRLVRWYAQMLMRAGLPVSLYAELPYCVVHGWPHWVDGSARDPHRDVDAFWETFLVDLPELADLHGARVERLDDERAAEKLAAMRTYRTQFPSLDGGHAHVLANPSIHRFEVVWDLARRTHERASERPGVTVGA